MAISELSSFQVGGLAIFVMLSGVWLFSVVKKDAGIIDAFWGLGFSVVALVGLLVSDNLEPITQATGLLVILWGVRLFSHLLRRWRGEEEEDPRYQAMRRKRGDSFWWRSIYVVFIFQGLLMWLVAMPYMAAFYFGGAAALPGLAILGLLIALAGLTMETLADIQLTRFRATAQPGDLLTDGWWKYTRHPNYFGDALFWWGIWLAVVAATPEAVWTIFAPALMNFLLVKVSGADLLEYRLRKKPGYEAYMERTNRFVPKLFG